MVRTLLSFSDSPQQEEDNLNLDSLKDSGNFSMFNMDADKAKYDSKKTIESQNVKDTGVESPFIYKPREVVAGEALTGGGLTTDIMNPVVDAEAMNRETEYRKKGTKLLQDFNAQGGNIQFFQKLSTEDRDAITDARQRESDRKKILDDIGASAFQKRAYNKELDQNGGILWELEKFPHSTKESFVDLVSLGYADRWDWYRNNKIGDIAPSVPGEVFGTVAGLAGLMLAGVEAGAARIVGGAGSTYSTLSATQAIGAETLAGAVYGAIWENGEDATWSQDIKKRFGSAIGQGILGGVLGTAVRGGFNGKMGEILKSSRYIPEEDTLMTQGEGFYFLTRGDGKAQRIIDAKSGNPVLDIFGDTLRATDNTPEYIRAMIRRGESTDSILKTATQMKAIDGATKDIVDAYQSALYYAPKGAEVRIVDNLTDVAGARVAGKSEGNVIYLDRELATKNVAMHEVTHAYISKMDDKARAALMVQAEKQYGTQNLVDLEERIADELYSYSAQKATRTSTLSGKLKETVIDIYNKLEGFIGKDQKLKTLYDDIISGKQYTGVTRSGEFYKRVSQSERIKGKIDEYDAKGNIPLPEKTGWSQEAIEKFQQLRSGVIPDGLKLRGAKEVGGEINAVYNTRLQGILDKIQSGAKITRARDRALAEKLYTFLGVEKPHVVRDPKAYMGKKAAQALNEELDYITTSYDKTIQSNMKELRSLINNESKAEMRLAELESRLDGILSPKDRMRIIAEAKRYAMEGNVRMKSLKPILKQIEDMYSARMSRIDQAKSIISKLQKSKSIDVLDKQEFLKSLENVITTKKMTAVDKEMLEAVQKGLNNADMTPHEQELFKSYLTDDAVRAKYDDLEGVQSIYDMSNDALDNLIRNAQEAYTYARDKSVYNNLQYENMIKAEVEKMTPEALDNGANPYVNTSIFDAMQSLKHYKDLAKAGFKGLTLNQLTPLHVFEYKLKAPQIFDAVSEPANQYMLDMAKIISEFNDIMETYKLEENNFRKIGMYLYATEGGNQLGLKRIAYQLQKTGINMVDNTTVTSADIPRILESYRSPTFLDEGEMKMANYMRQAYQDLGEKVRQTAYEQKNKVFENIENYFPHRQDWKANGFTDVKADFIDEASGRIMKNGGFLKKNIDDKFMEDRTGKLYILNYDAYGTFMSSIDNLAYFANVQGGLRKAASLIDTLGQDKLGRDGFRYAKEWLDVAARNGQGTSANTVIDRIAEKGAKAMSYATLGLNPGTVLVQLTNLADMVGVTGKIDMNLLKQIGLKDLEFVAARSGTVARKVNEWGQRDLLGKMRDWSMVPMQKIDTYTSLVGWKMMYDDAIAKGMSEADAILFSEKSLKHYMTTSLASDKALFISQNSRGVKKIFSMFMHPATIHYSNIPFLGGTASKYHSTELGGKMFQLMMVGGVATAVYTASKDLVNWARGKDDNRSLYEKAFDLSIMQFPIASMLMGKSQYGEGFVGWMKDARTGTLQLINGMEKGDDEQINAGLANLVKSIMMGGGVPGALTQNQWIIGPAIKGELDYFGGGAPSSSSSSSSRKKSRTRSRNTVKRQRKKRSRGRKPRTSRRKKSPRY